MLEDLTTDAFVDAFVNIAIRGTVRQIHSNQGLNFVRAKNEFEESPLEQDI